MDQQIIESPNGKIIVDSNGKTVTREGLTIIPNKGESGYGQVFIPANISTTGQDEYIEPIYNETDDEVEILDSSTLYNHTGFTYYVVSVDFENYKLRYNGGTPNPVTFFE